MTIDGDGDKDLPDEDKVTGDGLVHEGKNAIKKVETVNIDVNDGVRETLQAKCLQLQQQRQSQGAVFGWERFLHVTSIKVLLVENDDSTRHIVTALLRKCNYEVIKAANGLQAWKILENVSNHIDLVLTEVVMPCLSGIGLLCKIMSHNTRKNIPVIMMSSHDSMGLVFKCLSKGAVDFLLKPIRKNELKNLWQHVWRRCHSSSGSGSESGTQTQKSVKSKSREKSANNSGSDDGEDNGSNGLYIGDGSDDGSGSQSSWTKQAVEVDSSQAVSPSDQVPESPDSTCAQVNRSNAETPATRRAHMNASRGCQEADPCKPFATGILRNMESQPESVIEVPPKLLGAKNKYPVELDSNTSSLKMDKKQENPIINCPSTEYHVVTTEMSHPQIDSRELNKVMGVLESNDILIDDSKVSVVEISLKRLRGRKESGITFQDDRNVLRRSELSAFSRYSSSSNPTRTPNGITGSSFLNDNILEVAKIFLNPSSDVVSNNIDMRSTTNKLTIKPLPHGDKSEATPTINGLHPSSAFKPVKNVFRNSLQQAPQVNHGDVATAVIGPQGSHIDILIEHPHQHHNHHHVHNLNQRCSSNHEDLPLKKQGADGPFCAPSNILAGPCERNPEYDSLIRGASGSNPGSNGHYGCSTAINDRGANEESDTGLAGKSGNGDACGSGCRNTMDPSKHERAAALTKFRQRRKDKNKVSTRTEKD